jgi:TonB family protein
MAQSTKHAIGFFLGAGITALLALVLMLGTSSRGEPEKVLNHGAVRISPWTDKPASEDDVYATQDTPRIQQLENLNMSDMAIEMPQFDAHMAGMEMDFATELAGTVPMGGLPSPAPAGGLAGPSGGALSLGEVDELPHPLYAPPPLYPADQKRLGNERKVHVRIVLNEDGTVKSARPLNRTEQTAPFHEAAVEAVLQWRFFPCKKGGKAVRCVADQPFSFTIDD